MTDVLKNVLDPIINDYKQQLKDYTDDQQKPEDQRTVPAPDKEYVAAMKTLCLSNIAGRMEALRSTDPEYKQCSFLARCLMNGWTVSDIPFLDSMYEAIQGLANTSPLKKEGNIVLEQLAAQKVDTVAGRFYTLNDVNAYMSRLWRSNMSVYRPALNNITAFKNNTVFPAEYPDDAHFPEIVKNKDAAQGVSYRDIFEDDDSLRAFTEQRTVDVRLKEDYVIREVTDRERRREKEQPFVPNVGQRHNKMEKPASQIIAEVVGSSVYEDIDEMSRGDIKDRTVRIHHAQGTKHQKEGRHVLEMDFAGSRGEDFVKMHKQRNGAIDKNLRPKEYLERYGTRALKPDGRSEFEFIHYKDRDLTLPGGQVAKRKRYAIAGPTPDWWIISGLPNLGEYSIENSREYAKNFGAQFLEPIFDAWRANPDQEAPCIDIDLVGLSRGAVTAGQAAKLINKWIEEYADRHHEDRDKYKNQVFYNLGLQEPVPGAVTNLHLGSCNLRDIPNMNATVFCSLGIAEYDILFPLQQVKGAKKLILTMTAHSSDAGQDLSQAQTLRDNNKHMGAYYDAETGEMHRGSGINELPDGVYVADEKLNLIRLTSYSQVTELFGKAYTKTSPQRIRARNIHRMARDWFCENHLKMSFPDEKTRELETKKNQLTQDKILEIDSSRSQTLRNEITELRRLQMDGAAKEQIVAQNEKVIAACREYMKETTMPPYGDRARKINLVADTLTFTMRENNQLRKEIAREKNEPYDDSLDRKIKAQQDRLEQKEGYLQRKQAEEAKRLEQEKEVVKMIAMTKELCQQTIEKLENTESWKGNSSSYQTFHKALQEGADLTTKVSIRDLSDYYTRLKKASSSYAVGHDSVFGPITDDGSKRLGQSWIMEKFSKQAIQHLNKVTENLNEKKAPLADQMNYRVSKIQDLQQKAARLGMQPKKTILDDMPRLIEAGNNPDVPVNQPNRVNKPNEPAQPLIMP